MTWAFTTNVADLPKLSLPVRGTTSGDLSVVAGRDLYNSDIRMITLNGVPRAKGGVFGLQLLVKGPLAADARLSVGEVEPADVLQVEIDTAHGKSIRDGAVWLYPLTVTVPPNSRSVSRLGGDVVDGPKFGKIVIEARYPQTEQPKQLLLYVKFAVEG